jgi:hypothetical protein
MSHMNLSYKPNGGQWEMQKKTTDRRPNMYKAGARWAGHSDGDAQQHPTPVSLVYTVTKRGGAAVLRGGRMTLSGEGVPPVPQEPEEL